MEGKVYENFPGDVKSARLRRGIRAIAESAIFEEMNEAEYAGLFLEARARDQRKREFARILGVDEEMVSEGFEEAVMREAGEAVRGYVEAREKRKGEEEKEGKLSECEYLWEMMKRG